MTYGQIQTDLEKAIKGSFLIELQVDDQPTKFWSDDMIVFLDYQNAGFEFVIDPATLETDNSEYLDNVQKIEGAINLQGRYRMDRIPREKHASKNFDVYGFVSSDPDEDSFQGKGNMYHMNNAQYSSVVTLDLRLTAEQLGLDEFLPNTHNEIEISVKHTIPEDKVR